MDYNTFKDELKKFILNNSKWNLSEENYTFYPDGFTGTTEEDKEFVINTNIKYCHTESDTLIGDYILLNLENGVSRYGVKYLYSEFNSSGWAAVENIINQNITVLNTTEYSDIINHISDFEFIKEKLIVRPLNFTDNRYELKNNVYRKVGDIALVIYILLGENDVTGLTTIKAPKDILDGWNKSEDELFDLAFTNTNIYALPRIYMTPLELQKASYSHGAFMSLNSSIKSIPQNSIPTVTTLKQTNGAIALFYPGVMEKIAELFGAGYYIAFTSIHECILHHEDSISPRNVLQHLKSINKMFNKDEILSRKVFHYNNKTKQLEAMEL